MEEIFDMKDINKLFKYSKPMHDDVVTSIIYKKGKIIIEYGKIDDYDYYDNYKKVTVTYTLNGTRDDICLTVYKVTTRGLRCVPFELEDLNTWNVIMYKYSIDIFGEMTLYMNIDKGNHYRSVQLSFTPISIKYLWE